MKHFKINNEIFGKGETILFLHGWGGDKNSFNLIIKNIDSFYKIINIDLFGFGKTKMPKSFFDTYDYAMQIYLFLHDKNINELSIVAHSFGARIALILASVFDIKINTLIITGGAGVSNKNLINCIKIKYYKLCKFLIKYKIIPKKSINKFGSTDYKNVNHNLKTTFVKIVNQRLNYLLNKIHCKTILFWGDKDKSTPFKYAQIINKNIKNSLLIRIKNGSHFCHINYYINFINVINSYICVNNI